MNWRGKSQEIALGGEGRTPKRNGTVRGGRSLTSNTKVVIRAIGEGGHGQEFEGGGKKIAEDSSLETQGK